LTQTVNYYRQYGSHVFSCFIDFTKVFDNVDYWLLFCKLLDNESSMLLADYMLDCYIGIVISNYLCDGKIVHLGISALTKVCVKEEFCLHFFLAYVSEH